MNRIISPIRVYLKCKSEIASLFRFACGQELSGFVVIDEIDNWNKIYIKYKNEIEVIYQEVLALNSRYELEDISNSKARVEYGAIIRSGVTLADNCIILMGAVVNVGAHVGEDSMIDMNAVIGSGAYIGKRCHISAGAVIAGIMEPISTKNVVIEDDVFIGANAVILEGVRIKQGSVVGAGSVVTRDVEENTVVYGSPAVKIRDKESEDYEKVSLNQNLRK